MLFSECVFEELELVTDSDWTHVRVKDSMKDTQDKRSS